jgi:hypothetical protein
MRRIAEHTFRLAKYFYVRLENLKYPAGNGNPVARIYSSGSFGDVATQGGIVNFNLVSMLQSFFYSSLMTRPNKLEGLSLETLARPEQTHLEDLSDASFLGKLLVLPAYVRLDWKVIARYKHSSLFGLIICNEEKKFYNIDTWCQC